MNYSNLDDNSPKILQPNHLNIELMEHQKTAIYAMNDLEKKGYIDIAYRYFDNVMKDLRIETNIAILGDRVGSGKTLIISTFLVNFPKPPKRYTCYASDRYISIKERYDIANDDLDCNINVIMVPKGIQHQWEQCFETNFKDTINYVSINTSTDIKDKQIINYNTKTNTNTKIATNIVLCNEKTINDVITSYGNTIQKWNRLIIDEADTINYNEKDLKCKFHFIWLVTGTTHGISNSKRKYIKTIFNENLSWQPEFLTIKNSDKYIDDSLKLPVPKRIIIKCKTPKELKYVEDLIPKHIINMINAGNSDEAIKTLNCHVDTADNIFQALQRNYLTAIDNKKLELEAENKKTYRGYGINSQEIHNNRVKKIENVIEKLEKKIILLKKSLTNNDDYCSICMSEYTKQTMLDCCGFKGCFECITITTKTNNSCPVCKKKITKNKIHIVTDDNNDNNINKINNDNNGSREKMDELINIIRSKEDGRFLVFSDYDGTFTKIKKKLQEEDISYRILTTNSKQTIDSVKRFEKGDVKVIMLNAKNFGAGLNLQCATDIIIYHRFRKEMEEQIIGRGQRLGRTSKLNVHYLIHDNETNDYIGDNINDENFIDYIENV